LRQEISSTPMRNRPSSRPGSSSVATTRSHARPTVRHDTRHRRAIAVFVHASRQPRQQVIEVAGQLRSGPGERDTLDDHPVGGAAQPPQHGAQLDLPRAQIEVPPRRRDRAGVVASSSRVAAVTAYQPPSSQRDRDPHDRGQELDVGDVDTIKAQQALECSSDARGRGTSQSSRCRNHELWSQPVRVTRTPTSTRSPNPSEDSRSQPTHIRVRRA